MPKVVTAKKRAGPGEPAPHVAAVAGVLGDGAHRGRVQGLQHQRAQPADEHRGVAVHARDRAVRREPARPRRPVDPLPLAIAVRSRDPLEDRLAEGAAYVGDRRHAHAASPPSVIE